MLDKAPATIQGEAQILDGRSHRDADFIHHNLCPRGHTALSIMEENGFRLAGATLRPNSLMEQTTHATATFAAHGSFPGRAPGYHQRVICIDVITGG